MPTPHHVHTTDATNSRTQSSLSESESPLKALENYDIVIVFDDSASMFLAGGKNGRTPWDQAWDALITLVRVGRKYDKDGIDVHFLNDRKASKKVKSEADLQRLRKKFGVPKKTTHSPIGNVLDTLLLEYWKVTRKRKAGRSGVKKRVFLVITDGAPTDDPRDVIVRAANLFSEFPLDQVGIQFIQVGDDPKATEFLDELDQDLAKSEKTRDIVDTIKSNGNDLRGDALIKALTGGFNRKLDRMGERG